MTNREFVKWLAGFFTLSDSCELTKQQLFIISNHLNLAEAVEGSLGEFNQEVRKIISNELDNLEDINSTANQSVITELKSKILKRAEEI